MGCFSYLSPVTGDPICSDSFSGERCYLILLRNGKPVEIMYGNYDSYGRVFSNSDFTDSLEWSMDWNSVVFWHFHEDNTNGIVAVHERDFDESNIPKIRSLNDPNQGWGEYGCDDRPVVKPFHRILDGASLTGHNLTSFYRLFFNRQ